MSYVSLSNIVQKEIENEHRVNTDYVDNAVLHTFDFLNNANLLGNSFKINNGVVDVTLNGCKFISNALSANKAAVKINGDHAGM